MKRTSLTTLSLLVTLTLALSLDISAQQNAKAEKSKVNPSLERSLDQLGQGLKAGVVIEPQRFGGVRKIYVRLKQRGGCNISFEVTQVPGPPYGNGSNTTPPDLSTWEWRVNLSDLDIAEVKIETPAKMIWHDPSQGVGMYNEMATYRIIRFATIHGKQSIKRKGFSSGDVGWVSAGFIHIGKSASQVAAALEQAITACRE